MSFKSTLLEWINECCIFLIFFSHYVCQNSNLTMTGMLIISGEESYLDRLSLAQLTQLFLTSILECPFYKVKAWAMCFISLWGQFSFVPSPQPPNVFFQFLLYWFILTSLKQNFHSLGVSGHQIAFSLINWLHSYFLVLKGPVSWCVRFLGRLYQVLQSLTHNTWRTMLRVLAL